MTPDKVEAIDADAFRAWAEAKRYSDTTIVDAIRKVKRARSFGITRVEEAVTEQIANLFNFVNTPILGLFLEKNKLRKFEMWGRL